MNVRARFFRAALLLLGSLASTAHAAWAPFAVCQAPGVQQWPEAAPDGAGGAIVVWSDDRSGSQQLYVHHVPGSGAVDPAWPVNGRLVGPAYYDYGIVSDGAGGAIIAGATSLSDIKAYHILGSGALDPAWPSGGVTVRSGTGNAYWLQPVSDGAGGMVVAWSDDRNSATTGLDIYAQRVLSTGVVDPGWAANGAAVCAVSGDQVLDAGVSDGAGGIIAVWEDNRAGNKDPYAQSMLSTGVVSGSWPAGGRELCGADNDQTGILACSDGAGGTIVTWNDRRDNRYDVYAMRAQANGHLGTGWANDGELISDGGGEDLFVSDIVADGSGGAVISWGNAASSNVHVQKVTASGNAAWTPGGVDVSVAPIDQVYSSLALDGSGGVYVAWLDGRFSPDPRVLYVHHVLSSGSVDPAWPEDGGRVSYVGLPYFTKAMVTGSSGEATVVWGDGSDDLFAMSLASTWTAPLPVTVSAAPPIAGAVTRSPDLPAYGSGSSVTLTAVPGSGHTFIAWSGDASGSTNPLTITVDGPKAIAAIFDGYAVDVTVAPTGGGSVAKSPDQPYYLPETQVTLSATPATGYAFLNWSGDASGSTNPLTLTADAPKSITANFLGYSVDVTVSPIGAGTVAKSPEQATYAPGSQVTLTPTPAPGYVFSSWSGDASGSANPLTITVDGPKAIAANFTPPTCGTCGSWGAVASAVSPSARVGAPMVWDPVRQRVLMFGGHDGSNFLNDVWQFTIAGGWTQLTTSGTPPSPRDAVGLIYDPVRDRLLVVCGNNAFPPNDVWALSLGATPTWSPVSPTGAPPSGRFAFSCIYDPLRDRAILFGGYPNTNAVWLLSLAGTPAWAQLSPAGTPPAARYAHVGIYDPVRDRMLVHGGFDQVTTYGDTWALSLSGTPTWSQLSTGGTAPQVYSAASAYDSIRDRLVVISGHSPSSPEVDHHTWTLSLEVQPVWNEIPLCGTSPQWRYFHGAVYEPEADIVLTSQGIGFSGYMGDTKRLDCSGGWWLQTGGAHGTVGTTPSKACYDNGELVSLQAAGDPTYSLYQWLGDASGNANPLSVTMDDNKTIVAQFVTAVGVGDAPLTFALDPIHPNPGRGPLRVTYTLPQAVEVRVAVYDLAGRRVASLVDRLEEAGPHEARWDAAIGGRPARSGVYLIRLDSPIGSRAQRLVLIN